MSAPAAISDQEFNQFQRFIFDAAGITLSPSKKALVSGRLAKRLQHHGLPDYSAYLRMLTSGRAAGEVQMAVDLLTTNETYFFREPKHFDMLQRLATAPGAPRAQPFRVWSAASSSGEEAYTIAMVLAECLGDAPWEVFGSDISTRVLQQARTGHYSMQRARGIPPPLLKRYCLRGTGEQDGTLLVCRELRNRVRFTQVNLNESIPNIGMFDVVFLRNVMIYFSADTKRQVIARVIGQLKPGGHFFIGHSESLHELTDAVTALAPAIYRKPAAAKAAPAAAAVQA